MAEQVINTLNAKRHDIEAHIGSLEQDLEQARRDLSAILAAIKVFSSEGPKVTAYMNMHRVFPRHELPKLAKAALQASPDGISTVAVASPRHCSQGAGRRRQASAEGHCLQAGAGVAAVGEAAGGEAVGEG